MEDIMPYTVNQLAKLSGVSIRTLRFYDEIGLLKPAYYGANGYRYYEEKELLLLQQILFYRELGIDLKKIGAILGSSDFNIAAALHMHRKTLKKQEEKIKRLIRTIDNTLEHLKGVKKMAAKDIYAGFTKEEQEAYEKQLIEYGGDQMKEVIAQSKTTTDKWTKQDWADMQKEAHALHEKVSKLMEEGKSPSSPEVQKLIAVHYLWINKFWKPTQETYKGLAQLYLDMPQFKKWFDKFRSDLLPFFAEAMKVYADRNL